MANERLAEALKSAVPEELRSLCRVLSEHKKRSWIVGGSVRDVLSSLEKSHPVSHRGDWDLATDARPEEVMTFFKSVIPTGIQHGTVTVVLNGRHFEVTTLRGEIGHSDGRRPDEVYFVEDLHEDLLRRDFTVNAMAYNLMEDSFHDPFGGEEDHKKRLLRAVGDPAARFSEDGLRVLRCARFTATLGFEIEPETRKAIQPSLATFKKVAQERVRDEWQKALQSPTPSRFLHVIYEEQMLSITLPDHFIGTSAAEFAEVSARVDEAPRDFIARLSVFALLGMKETLPAEARRKVGEEIAKTFRLSRSESARLVSLVQFLRPTPALLKTQDGSSVRHYLARIGRTYAVDVANLLPLARPFDASLLPTQSLADASMRELTSGAPLALSELSVSGKDLIDAGILTPGRAVGQVLNRLLEVVLTEPEKNERTSLLTLARALAE